MFKPLHVVNITIKDSPEESAAAAGDVLEICRTVNPCRAGVVSAPSPVTRGVCAFDVLHMNTDRDSSDRLPKDFTEELLPAAVCEVSVNREDVRCESYLLSKMGERALITLAPNTEVG